MCSLCSCRCRLKEDSALSQQQKKSMTSIVATTSCGSNGTETLSAATSAPAARSGAGAFDRENPMWWHMLDKPDQLAAVAAAHKAVDMLWFVHGLSFALINSPLFAAAVDKIKAAPGYKPCYRTTLATSHLSARNDEANEYKDKRLEHGKQYGFLVTSDWVQWYQFSGDSDEKLLDIQDVSDLRAAPTAILQALIPHDQWTLDK